MLRGEKPQSSVGTEALFRNGLRRRWEIVAYLPRRFHSRVLPIDHTDNTDVRHPVCVLPAVLADELVHSLTLFGSLARRIKKYLAFIFVVLQRIWCNQCPHCALSSDRRRGTCKAEVLACSEREPVEDPVIELVRLLQHATTDPGLVGSFRQTGALPPSRWKLTSGPSQRFCGCPFRTHCAVF